MNFNLMLYVALALCAVAVVSLVVAVAALVKKRAKAEWIAGAVALSAAVVSLLIYYYLRIVESGGTLQDWRVVLVLGAYAVIAILGALSLADGKKKVRKGSVGLSIT